MVCMVRHVKERATSSFTSKSSRTRIRISSGREVGSIMGSLLALADYCGDDVVNGGACVVEALSQIGYGCYLVIPGSYRNRHWHEAPTESKFLRSDAVMTRRRRYMVGNNIQSHDLDRASSAPCLHLGRIYSSP